MALPVAAKKPAFVMPRPPAIVVWRNAPGGETNYAIVTKYGRSAISVLIFPSESRVGVPKDGVRFIDDPALKGQAFADSGVWEFTEESKVLAILVARLIPAEDGSVTAIPTDASKLRK